MEQYIKINIPVLLCTSTICDLMTRLKKLDAESFLRDLKIDYIFLMHICPVHISEPVCVSIVRHDWWQPTGPAPLPRTRPGGPALSSTTIHSNIRGSSTKTATAPPFWGLPEVYRRAQRRVDYSQQMGPDIVRWGRIIFSGILLQGYLRMFFFLS